MREDFHSAFTGAPGVRYPYARTVREPLRDDDGHPVLRSRRVRRLEKGCREEWCRNFGLVGRFLRSRLGRPWVEVRAEMAGSVRGTPSGVAVLQHADRIVAPWGIRGGRLLGPRGDRLHGFYVDAEGRLAELPQSGYRDWHVRQVNARLLDPDAMPLGQGREFKRIDGIWYVCLPVGEGAFAADRDRTRIEKRQLSKVEIDRYGLRNWPGLVTAFAGSIRNRNFDRGMRRRMERLAEAAARALDV